jgi:maleate isomerase
MNPQQKALVKLSDCPLSYVDPRAWKRFGLLALATDLTLERDIARLIPHETVGVYTTRVAFENPTTPENLRNMAPSISAAANLILPGEPLDVICYGCTSASVVIGDDVIRDAIHSVRPGVPVVTPSGAARLAFAALGVSRISVLTPYLIETSEPMANYFSEHGMTIENFECLGLEDDRPMARVTRDTIIEAVCQIDTPQTEALFVSCTALPAVAAIAEIEARTGKPVVTSNQASSWAMMRLAGIDHKPQGYGRLFDLDIFDLDIHH